MAHSSTRQPENIQPQSIVRGPWWACATPLVGKAVRGALRVTKHGGSALPGRVIERLDPGFLARTLAQLPLGVVLVSGTNGKTTTTRMVASILRDLGLRVFTNPTGSNFTRGVVSALLSEVSAAGQLDADIAVLELDEAYAVHFVRQVRPRYALLLNVLRDQLDRFGEIDTTAKLLGQVAATTSGTVVLNREDPRIARLARLVGDKTEIRYFGLSDDLVSTFPTDDTMHDHAGNDATPADAPRGAAEAVVHPGNADADVVLTAVGHQQASFTIDGQVHNTDVALEGVYNLYNAAAALAVVRAVLRDCAASPETRLRQVAHADAKRLVKAVSTVTPAFGRGEIIMVNGSPVELLLVKNPMGFRMSLHSFPPDGCDTMIAINDEYADGRDMSWLWDVDFASLRETGVEMVSGVRAWDMALRLGYEQVETRQVEPDLATAIRQFTGAHEGVRKHVYCTYTAMLRIRAELGRLTQVADAGVGR